MCQNTWPWMGTQNYSDFIKRVLSTFIPRPFLALLDSVSRAYSMGLLSVVRLWHRLSLKLLHGFLSNFSCGFPWAIFPEVFSSARLCQQSSWNQNSSSVRPSSVCAINYLWTYCMDFFQILVVASPGQYAQTFFKIIIIFFIRIFKRIIFFIRIFFIFVNMGPYGSQNFKTLLLPQITFESFQPFPEFSSQWSSQRYCFGFLKFWVSNGTYPLKVFFR